MKKDEREAARRLRRERGLSIKGIADELGVAVSSVSRWTRDIELTPAQEAHLEARNPALNRQRKGQESRARSARAARVRAQNRGREAALRGDRLHAMGCMLYWAEGSKSRNAAALTNSDPDLLSLFLRFLRGPCGVTDDRVALTVNCRHNEGLRVLHPVGSGDLRRDPGLRRDRPAGVARLESSLPP